MGIISLPVKPEYCNTRGLWPKHKPLSYVSFSRFKTMWENIHLSSIDQENEPEKDPERETVNWDETSTEEVLSIDARWYAKAEPLTGNVKKVSQNL